MLSTQKAQVYVLEDVNRAKAMQLPVNPFPQ